MDPEVYQHWTFWTEIGVTIALGLIVISLLLRGVALLAKSAKISTLALRPLSIIVRWIGILVIFGLVLERFGISVMTTLATVLAMVAIGVIAVWSMLSHITATFLLILTKPFQVGDWVGFAGEEIDGKVIDLTLFYTTLESVDGELFRIPNNMFFQKVVRVKATPGTSKRTLEEQLAKEPTQTS
jgi:small-conductance mechanosensitive channel